jgi:hypothetical protein
MQGFMQGAHWYMEAYINSNDPSRAQHTTMSTGTFSRILRTSTLASIHNPQGKCSLLGRLDFGTSWPLRLRIR